MSGRYRIGQYAVDFDSRRIWLGDQKLQIHWRGFEALRELAEARGEVVGRERLFEVLWPGAVVDESNLGKVISQLRRTLDEGAPGIEHIETLPGTGYRLTAPLEPISPEATVPPPVDKLPWRGITAGAALAGVMAAGWGAFAWWPERERARQAREAMGRGQEIMRIRDPGRSAEAVAYFRRATELNPKSAEAYASLAQALDRQGGVGTPLGPGSPALAAAKRAVELDPDCAGCNGSLGLMLLSHAWQWDRALVHIEKAIRLSPANHSVRPSYALALLVKGRREEALAQIGIAIQGSPFQPSYYSIRARTLYMLERYPEAVEAADRARGIQPTDPSGWEWRSQALMQMGQVEKGIEAITAVRFQPYAARASAAVRLGGPEAGLRVLIEAAGETASNSYRRARWKAMLRDDEGALAELERAREFHHFELMFVAVEPVFERLRGHPRFQRLLGDMGLG